MDAKDKTKEILSDSPFKRYLVVFQLQVTAEISKVKRVELKM